ncbi:hypothetical protein [Paenibacillus polymyxa]|uniref:hypothetical protein n=1 Tax=Paenibacillus polymyxa TaxID=1406 RepID=UPI001F20EA1E|nr:hypothetical protein [Paenibacillus polymyxa]
MRHRINRTGIFVTLIADKPVDRLYAQLASNGSVRGRKGCTGDSRGDCKLTCCTGLSWT